MTQTVSEESVKAMNNLDGNRQHDDTRHDGTKVGRDDDFQLPPLRLSNRDFLVGFIAPLLRQVK